MYSVFFLAGLFVVGLSIVFAYGLAMFCGVIYGPVHALMPFLLLGNSHIII
jgi:predicted RND superfamily exporter protein